VCCAVSAGESEDERSDEGEGAGGIVHMNTDSPGREKQQRRACQKA
jgi:hypothetical protein